MPPHPVDYFAQITIVLANTTHPGNLGATARALKNMGFANLVLVQPRCDRFAMEARARAAGAIDLLEQAVIVNTLAAAVKDCHLVFGSSSRECALAWPTMTAAAAAEYIGQKLAEHNPSTASPRAAIVFGSERNGLSTEELQACHFQLQIPASSEYAALNLAQAVQVVVYELRKALLALLNDTEHPPQLFAKAEFPPANFQEIEYFYEHLETVLLAIGFLEPKCPRKLLPRLRRIFNRVNLDQNELNILRGILSAVQSKLSYLNE